MMLILAMFPAAAAAKSGKLTGASLVTVQGINVDVPTQQQIKDYILAAGHQPFYYGTSKTVEYDTTPQITEPYAAGVVNDAYLQDGLNTLNQMRYIAGVPSGVTLDADYNRVVQKAAVVIAANGALSHDPGRPTNMGDDIYTEGQFGASKSNLAHGFSLLSKSIINGYMYDGDSSNIPIVGHRRWILNPSMGKTGFGFATNNYSGMYAVDTSGTIDANKHSIVAWPAQNMPTEYMRGGASGTPYSVSLSSAFDAPVAANISITMTRLSDGHVWTFSSSSNTTNYWVNNGGYGQPRCIIWRPTDIAAYNDGDTYSIVINGVKKGGVAVPISYNVKYFSLIGNIAAPANFKANNQADGIKLTWDKVPGAAKYEIWAVDADVTTVYQLIDTVTTTEYLDGMVKNDYFYHYKYKVRAYGEFAGIVKYGGYSSEIAMVRLETLATPSNPKAQSSSSGIKVSWDVVLGATTYEIFKKSGSSFTLLASISEPNYTDTNVTAGTTYTYKVRTCLEFGGNKTCSALTPEISAVANTTTPPAVPSGLKAVSGSYNSIILTWKASAGATGYKIYRNTASTGSYQLIKTTASTSFTNTGLTMGKKYYYKVLAYKSNGGKDYASAYSSVVSSIPVPSAPAGVKASSKSYNSILIKWNAVSGAAGYKIYSATSSTGSYKLIKTTSSTSFTNTGLTTGKKYYYKIKAYKSSNNSPDSSAVSAAPVPATPGAVKLAKTAATAIKISFGKVAGATGYEIYRATSSGGSYTKVIDTKSTSYTNTGLEKGKTYYYKVRAYRTVSGTKKYGNCSTVVHLSLPK
jgi:fibronectin type 3 domain-containing protein